MWVSEDFGLGRQFQLLFTPAARLACQYGDDSLECRIFTRTLHGGVDMGNSRIFFCESPRRRASSPAAVHLNAPTEGSLLRPRGPLTLDRLACDLPSAFVPSFASRFLPWHGFPSVAPLCFRGRRPRLSRLSLCPRPSVSYQCLRIIVRPN